MNKEETVISEGSAKEQEELSELRKIIKKERDRIESDLMEYMEGTYLEQDSIFLQRLFPVLSLSGKWNRSYQ